MSVLGRSQLVDFGEMLCGTVDVTNPDAYNWYKGVIKVICLFNNISLIL